MTERLECIQNWHHRFYLVTSCIRSMDHSSLTASPDSATESRSQVVRFSRFNDRVISNDLRVIEENSIRAVSDGVQVSPCPQSDGGYPVSIYGPG